MLGLALEGGGARGAFQMGVVKALLEEGYAFDGVTGTSIGAINGAMIAQEAFEEGYALWEKAYPSLFFNLEDETFQKLINRDVDKDTLLRMASKLRMIIRNKGVDTSGIRRVLEEIIDEDRIRKSKILFGLVTVSLSDFKACELYKEDIPVGKMVDYLIASATFPGFKLTRIDDRRYIDGGVINNCPINLLANKGFKEIIAVRTLAPGIYRSVRNPDIKLTVIKPSDDLGRILDFSNALIKRNLKMGYYDAIRRVKGLKGRKYTIKPVQEDLIFHLLQSLSEESIQEMGKIYGFEGMNPKRMLFEEILPQTSGKLGLARDASYQDIVIALLEVLAEQKGINKYEVYTFEDFMNLLKTDESNKTQEPGYKHRLLDKKPQLLKAAQTIIGAV